MKHPRLATAVLLAAALAGAASAAPAAEEQGAPPIPAGGERAAEAVPGSDGPGPRHARHMGAPALPFLRGIELTEAQQDRVFAIMHAQAPQLREHDKAERKAHAALRDMMDAGRYDEAQASAQARALGQAIAARELLRVRAAAQVLALLTPEQKEALNRERGPRAPRR